MTAPLVTAHDLAVSRGGRRAVERVAFTLAPGEALTAIVKSVAHDAADVGRAPRDDA